MEKIRMWDKHPISYFPSACNNFWGKKYFVADPDPGLGAFLNRDPGWENLDRGWKNSDLQHA
jgi:hypothetical protein